MHCVESLLQVIGPRNKHQKEEEREEKSWWGPCVGWQVNHGPGNRQTGERCYHVTVLLGGVYVFCITPSVRQTSTVFHQEICTRLGLCCILLWLNINQFQQYQSGVTSQGLGKNIIDLVPAREPLTHWGWVTHICVSKLTIIGSDNGLVPGWCQVIIWTNAGIL